jgi:hypothetical protein
MVDVEHFRRSIKRARADRDWGNIQTQDSNPDTSPKIASTELVETVLLLHYF